MATQGQSFYDIAEEAGADLSNQQYHLVRYTGENTINISSNSTDRHWAGVLQDEPQSGEFGTVRRGGKQKVVAGASMNHMDEFTCNGSGRAVAVSSGSTDLVMGRVLEAPSADGEIFTADVYQSPYIWPGIAF